MFGIIKSDDKVFIGDKIRFNVAQSFFDVNETAHTTSHEISFDAGVTYLNITTDKYADYAFSTAGDKVVTLRLTKAGTPTVSATYTKTVTVLAAAIKTSLFSTDNDLYQYEPEIDRYLPDGRSSWNMQHYRAQTYIMDWLAERGYRNQSGAKYVVADLLDKQEVNQFSCFKALEFIYEGNINIVGDLSTIKRDKYQKLAVEKASMLVLSLDYSEADDDTNEAKQSTNMHVINVSRK